MRWTGSQAEVANFGVNYTAPFAYSYRAHQRLGIPIERAIDSDVYHFARLGFDAYRVHIWDREISDAQGNLLVNEHLKAFDYLLWQLKNRGIKIVLTALQFGDAGYPEPGVPLPGFSSKYNKRGSLEQRESWPLQERYLAQLMSHVNPHTGVAYKDDPDVMAVEICNEPGHFEYQPTLDYINTMVLAIRSTGYEKPILYNMSHGIPVHQAYLDADVQGGTFQWYPSNLVAGHEQRGNFLPYVDDYPIPFAADPKFRSKAKVVYEFDAADIGRSYIYPAIARTFRKAGFQIATHFAYDPLYLAPYNTEYQTHYLNLAYTPSKAIGMKVAGEAFRRIPLRKDYGRYPQDTSFAGVRISYENDLAELVTEKEFYYSNTTTSRPPQVEKLEHIAGVGTSQVFEYEGTGAYFLDRLEPGTWRLELMPDVIWVRDPFEKPSPDKQVARIAWNARTARIHLPDLGAEFEVRGLNSGNALHQSASNGEVTLTPGAYLVTRAGKATSWNADSRWQNITLKEFVAPPASLDKTYVLHTAAAEAPEKHDLEISATIASPEPVESVQVFAYAPHDPRAGLQPKPENARAQPGGAGRAGAAPRIFSMHASGLHYTATLPSELVTIGDLRYFIVVKTGQRTLTFPSETKGSPLDWSFFGQPFHTQIVAADAPVLLFDAAADSRGITADHRDDTHELVPSDRPGIRALSIALPNLEEETNDYSLRFYFREKLAAELSQLRKAKNLVLYGRVSTGEPFPVQLALITRAGAVYGATTKIETKFAEFRVPISALKPVRSPNIPHGYPVFIPRWSEVFTSAPLDLSEIESVLVSIGPDIPPEQRAKPRGLEIERIWLE